MAERPFYVTTPIYYVSGNPHVGHAYTSIAADVLTRFHRTRGEAFFLTGTDEHGQKIAEAAAAAGLAPQAFTDSLVGQWQRLCATYSVAYDDFIRTTEPRHTEACIAVFERLKERGDVYVGTYEGWYCTNDETFWLESKLIDGRCPNPECRREVKWLSEENWFFALSKYRDRLLAYYKEHSQWLRPSRAYNEMLATLEGGLEDLCISRVNLEWGIPLPGGGVMYVWLDALLNYITALGWPDGERLKKFWPASVQLVGKEIARFHTIIWPAVLWALDLPVPELIFAHGWITIDGEKMSKSRGNVIDPFAVAERFGADAVRYFLLREAPFGSDFSISEEKIRLRHNGDLGNDLGNLVRRSLAMLGRYRNGLVPQPPETSEIGERFSDLGDRVAAHLQELGFRERALELDATLYELCEGVRWLAHLLAPFMPSKAAEIWHQLGFEGSPSADWREELQWGRLAAGTQTQPADLPLFPRIEADAA
jgi:methionyl-tRNA synthetase